MLLILALDTCEKDLSHNRIIGISQKFKTVNNETYGFIMLDLILLTSISNRTLEIVKCIYNVDLS